MAECKEKLKELEEKEKYRDKISAQRRVEKEKAQQTRNKIRLIKRIVALAIVFIIAVSVFVVKIIVPRLKYNNAVSLMNDNKCDDAISIFKELDGYKNSTLLIDECNNEKKYQEALKLMKEGKYENALINFNLLKQKEYKDSKENAENCQNKVNESDYAKALRFYEEAKYNEAIVIFKKLGNYKDSEDQAKKCNEGINNKEYEKGISLYDEGKYEHAIKIFEKLGDYQDSKEKLSKSEKKVREQKEKSDEEKKEKEKKENIQIGIVKTDEGNLNVRSGPSASDKKIGSVTRNSEVKIYSEINGWYEIEYNGGTGYVSGEFVRIKGKNDEIN